MSNLTIALEEVEALRAQTARTDTQELARACGVSVARVEADLAQTLREIDHVLNLLRLSF